MSPEQLGEAMTDSIYIKSGLAEVHADGIPSNDVGSISGTDLRLSITQPLVEVHGGRITLDSQINQGTTFTVVIPLTQA